ncbi:MAG: phage holin family protein [Betaproteobacteria bacterium]|nr:phage holin family protein [Betaproteobacteria bacterium]MDE2622422.1 phage holin family protein [Betaproteobacteria bacterium]
MSPSDEGAGFAGGAVHAATTALEALRTRLELIGLELADAQDRLVRRLLWGALALVLLVLGLLAALVWASLAWWENRLWLSGLIAVAGLSGGTLLALWAARKNRTQPFHDSVAELSEDVRALKAAVHHEPPP